MDAVPSKTIYLGAFAHTKSLGDLDAHPHGAIGVNDEGRIAFLFRGVKTIEEVHHLQPDWKEAKVVRAPEYGFFFPGFIGRPVPNAASGNDKRR